MANQFDSNLLPASSDTYDVGSTLQRWKNLYAQTLRIVSQLFSGATSGTTTLQASAIASGTLTLPAATDTLVGRATTDTLTNKTLSGVTVSSWTAISGVTPTGNAVPVIVAKYDATGQTANVGSTNIYAVPVAGAGTYRITAHAVVTTAAGVTSTLPSMSLAWTDNDSSTATSAFMSATFSGNTLGTNSTQGAGGQNSTVVVINAKASTNISFSTSSYASNPANAMQYAVHVKLEYLG